MVWEKKIRNWEEYKSSTEKSFEKSSEKETKKKEEERTPKL